MIKGVENVKNNWLACNTYWDFMDFAFNANKYRSRTNCMVNWTSNIGNRDYKNCEKT